MRLKELETGRAESGGDGLRGRKQSRRGKCPTTDAPNETLNSLFRVSVSRKVLLDWVLPTVVGAEGGGERQRCGSFR